jgi:photosystem II stability/assembly factor-like uncharacterized protein
MRRSASRSARPAARRARALRPSSIALLGVLLALGACRRTPEPVPAGPFWRPQPAATAAARGASLRGVRAVTERVAWASGSRGTVLRTTDGGTTWTRLPVPQADSLDFRSLWAFDSLTAVVASAGDAAEGQARVYRTDNGGRSWTLAHRDTTKGIFYDAVAFWDARYGLMLSDPVDGRFVTLATDDGGRSWRRTPPEGMPPALEGEAAFAAGNAALAVAGRTQAWFVTGGPRGARVYRTLTGGARWDASRAGVQPASASAGLFAVAFRSSEVGVATGGDYRVARDGTRQFTRSTDGGRSWSSADEAGAAAGYWSGLAYVPGGRSATLVAVGLAGTAISRDDGRTWAVVDTTALHGVSVAAPGVAWAVGPGGRMLMAPSVR